MDLHLLLSYAWLCVAMCCHGYGVLLDFAGKLDGSPNVPAVEVEIWVEVFLSCDGRGVVGTGTLGNVTLIERERDRRVHAAHQRWLQVACKTDA